MKQRLLFSMCMCLGLAAYAQTPTHPQYVKLEDPDGGFAQAYRNWEPGQPLSSDLAEDEEFFISRVRLKERFNNAQTQVDPQQSTERKCFWWVPFGQSQWNGVPTYYFNSEVFNMWSYIDNYGNWTAPVMRAPGAFLDACHKNGVSTSVVASVPWAANIDKTSDPHGKNFDALTSEGYEKYLKFLRYYGIDGFGVNSEFSFTGSGRDMVQPLKDLIANADVHKAEFDVPSTNFAWYSLTDNSGGLGMANELNSSFDEWFYNTKIDGKVANLYFCNYNWGASELQTSVTTAKKYPKASSYDVYAGMNMQAGGYVNWTTLYQYPISVGLWGAHDMNMLFESRGEAGSSGMTPQETYVTRSELFFTGGSRNPVNVPAVNNKLSYSLNDAKTFHGISSFLTARSSLQTTDLGKEPFVTYFNLGNGLFFNVNGETTFNKEWYNVGIQDYLPTWRWWFTSSFMGRDKNDVPEEGLDATFTWEDAWFGGSCMKIYGTTDQEYLQLFKTKFPLEEGDVLTIRYKVLGGTGELSWACSAEGAESTEVSANIMRSVSEYDTWIEKSVEVGSGLNRLKMAGETMAMMGLKFANADNLNILIGEISLTRAAAVTPEAPILKKSSVLGYNYLGADLKIVFSMDKTAPTEAYKTTYNSDVNTWMFKIYTQEEGQDAVMCTATTSWAAYVVGAPVVDSNSKIRIGVSALSLDGKTESEITWGEYLSIPEPTISEGLTIDKPVIKANEEFTVRYTDPNHSAAKKWEVRDSKKGDSSEVLLSSDGGTSMSGSLSNVGQYDLALTFTKGEKDTTEIYRGMIQISGPEVGAMPQIKEVKVNNSSEGVDATTDDKVTYSYVGRDADGTVSRALTLPEVAFGLTADQLDIDGQSPFSIACWFKPDVIIHGKEGVGLLNIRDPKDGWPANNWGFVWQDVMTDNTIQTVVRAADNKNHAQFRDPSFTIEAGRWYHMCLVLDYDQIKGRVIRFYLNGRLLGERTSSNLYSWRRTNYIMFGGYQANRASFKGAIDEFQLYNKALNDQEAYNTMNHQTEISENLIGYWDFESEPAEDGYLYSTGSDKSLKASILLSGEGDGGEGSSSLAPGSISFDAGAPFLTGKFEVKTTPDWGIDKKAKMSDENVTATEGSVKVNYTSAGEYSATLTLKNSWGTDTKTFPVVVVTQGSGSGVESASSTSTDVYPNPFENELYINFAEAGAYTVQVYGLAGDLVSEQGISALQGDVVRVAVNAAPGTYIVKVMNKDAKTVKAVKVIKK